MRLPSTTAIGLEASTSPSHTRIETAARELETQFAQLLIKSMRSASMGDPILGGNTTYREMYDQQLARELSKGRGLGLAPMIVRQLERANHPAPPATTPAQGTGLKRSDFSPGMPMPLPAGALPLTPSSAGVSMPALDVQVTPSLAPASAASEPACPSEPLDCSSPEAFVRSIWPHAQRTAAQLGVSAKALVAQAALETGWGRRLVGDGDASSHNLFGIKAGNRWHGERMNASTHEFVDGVRRGERAQFRAYDSPAGSFADYARLLSQSRYAAARGTGEDIQGFANALQKAGYATDPSYAAKLSAIAHGATLNRALAMISNAPAHTHAHGIVAAAVAPTSRG